MAHLKKIVPPPWFENAPPPPQDKKREVPCLEAHQSLKKP